MLARLLIPILVSAIVASVIAPIGILRQLRHADDNRRQQIRDIVATSSYRNRESYLQLCVMFEQMYSAGAWAYQHPHGKDTYNLLWMRAKYGGKFAGDAERRRRLRRPEAPVHAYQMPICQWKSVFQPVVGFVKE